MLQLVRLSVLLLALNRRQAAAARWRAVQLVHGTIQARPLQAMHGLQLQFQHTI
jgi:hypothetical protein